MKCTIIGYLTECTDCNWLPTIGMGHNLRHNKRGSRAKASDVRSCEISHGFQHIHLNLFRVSNIAISIANY